MAVLILILIVAYMLAFVSPSSNNCHPLAPKNDDVCFKSLVQNSPDGYYLNLSIGTKHTTLETAIVSTALDFSWFQCETCGKHCLYQTTPIYNPKKSLSYSTLKCSSKFCNLNFTDAMSSCDKHGDCRYEVTYNDEDYSVGLLATETFTFGGNVSIEKLYFGCGFNNSDDYNTGYPAVLALGRGNLSFASQMNVSRFSYCLPQYNTTAFGYISMGCSSPNLPEMKTTPIIKNPSRPTYYYLLFESISIGKTKLPINSNELKIRKGGSGGMVIDSGTTLTLLETSVFDQVTKELTNQLKLPSFNYTMRSDIVLCYNITRHTKIDKFPNFVFHFDNASFVVKHQNYFQVMVPKKFGCLMMASSPYDLNIFGTYQHQNAMVIYDLAKDKLSFLTDVNCAA